MAYASSSLNRVCIALQTHGLNSINKRATFLDCVVRYFEPEKHFVTVKCSLAENVLTLCGPVIDGESNDFFTDGDVTVLQHSPECPIANLDGKESQNIQEDVTRRGVAVGVAVVLESSDNRILMTRRSDHLRTFPKAWVPPGGHIEMNESLIQAGLRELEEETGILLDVETSTIKVLCLWESVYPLLLGLGLPNRHHIVVYLHAFVDKPWHEIHKEVKLDPSEVQACTWLTPELVKKLLIGKKGNLGSHKMFRIEDNGSMQQCDLELNSMFHHLLWREGKVYSGSQLAMTKWMEHFINRSAPPSKI